MKYVIGIIALALVGGATYTLLPTHHDNHGEHEHHDDHDHAEDSHDDHSVLAAKEPVRADGTFTIATSFYPLAYALERIAGDLAVVENIGAGRDPHDFRPSTQDILALQQADLVVLQGAAFEPWGDDVKKQLQAESVPVVLATAELPLMAAGEQHHDHDEHEESDTHMADEHADDHHNDDESGKAEDHDDHDHAHGDYDPHTWLDPVLMSATVEKLAEALSVLDPENALVYQENATALQNDLVTLHAAYETGLTNCQVDEVIVSHDAFGYVAERYGFTIHSIAGLSTQDTPSAQTLAELKEEAEEGVRAILLEENSVTAFGETLANETGLQTLSINPIAFLIPDGEDYLSLMQTNLETFQTALDCNG